MNDNTMIVLLVAMLLTAAVVLILTGHGVWILVLAVVVWFVYCIWGEIA